MTIKLVTHKLIMGIDPGQSGAISILSFDSTYYMSFNLKNLTQRDISDALETQVIEKAFIEKVHSMPDDGVKSAWSFSGSYHTLKMGLICHKIPFEEVAPFTWQCKMKCRTKGDKNVSKRKAQELFPNIKITHANADSLLIAEFGRKYVI